MVIRSFSQLRRAKVLVLGDFMLDTYTTGRVERVSPEAPVPILHVQQTEDLPGGAGNVVLNLQTLGAEVIAVGRVGDDKEGLRLKQLLKEEGTDVSGIFTQKGVSTPLKNRLIAGGQQLIRVDQECISPLSSEVEEEVVTFIESHKGTFDVIAISDYAKGFLSHSLLQKVLGLAKEWGIPTIVDPKGNDFTKYQGATLVKPNYKEAVAASKLTPDADLDAIGEALLEEAGAEMIMVTRSEEGISLFERGKGRQDFPVKSREVKDVTGAGDTVLAMTTMTFASKLPLNEGLELSNVAAGIAIERLGCVPVSLSELAERLLETSVSNKIFDGNHIFALEQALIDKELTILGINTEEGVSSALFSQIQKLAKQKEGERLMIYLIDSDPDPDFLSILSSLHEVDFIVIQSDSLASLTEKVAPKRVYTLGSDGLLIKAPLSRLMLEQIK
ncbi:D-glycero-beta-D-manno-heptose-7-phosphate kinase [Candidatus Neptunochlamydia vexilliferae]|uniref:Bifunctional protein HldE n=1 Tax=Candidatus Neptunichlamydia vexilliferae TaxID=1651774 RepID=A0ABS0AYB1_9BACT|nr:D-glycero-beta-D-manno-heptose-7-phosphate kinase [Candidatus Neptunochlamydia vexilliferae]MBF5058582.1 Bifunctional protein HldE [Candidatus Neptunochlamydia vexilliferae]